jgi:hypothetical protein
MATTTNFGWTTPDDTSLVKDGAAAIRTLGQSIDTSMMDLEGGTTGQVLSKASNTDMDFTWVTTDDTNAIQNAIVDAKGDLIAATAADTPARLAVGTNGQLLSADSTAATGLAWVAAPTAGSMTSIASGSLSTGTLSLTGIVASYKNLQLVLRNAGTSATCNINLRVNNLSTGIYSKLTLIQDGTALGSVAQQNATSAELNGNNIVGSQTNTVIVDILDYANTTSYKQLTAQLSYKDSGTSTMENALTIANMNMTAAIDRIDITLSSGTFNAGTYILYGVN